MYKIRLLRVFHALQIFMQYIFSKNKNKLNANIFMFYINGVDDNKIAWLSGCGGTCGYNFT
jgi:hypothetical protein